MYCVTSSVYSVISSAMAEQQLPSTPTTPVSDVSAILTALADLRAQVVSQQEAHVVLT
jgi:hypothetical protein